MKNTIPLFKLLIFIFLFVSLVSCDDSTVANNLANKDSIYFVSSIHGVRSLPQLDIQNTQLEKNQKVGLVGFNSQGGATLFSNISLTAEGNGSFSHPLIDYPQGDVNANIIAYHPYNASLDVASLSAVSFAVSQNQSLQEDYLNSDILYCTSNQDIIQGQPVALVFNHMFSKIKFSLKLKTITFGEYSFYTILNVATSAQINLSTGTISAIGNNSDVKPYIPVLPNGSSDELQMVVILPPQNISSGSAFLKVQLFNDIYTFVLDSDIVLKKGYTYTCSMTIDNIARRSARVGKQEPLKISLIESSSTFE